MSITPLPMSASSGPDGGKVRVQHQPLRVCVLTAAYPASSEPTRAIFIENLCRALAGLTRPGGELRFELQVVAPRIHREDALREQRGGIPVRRFRYPSGGKRLKEHAGIPYPSLLLYLLSGFAVVLSEVRRSRAAVIHCHWVLPAGVIAALVSRVTGVPVVFHAHGSDLNLYGGSSPLMRRLTRWVLRPATRVLSVSAALSKKLEEDFGVRAERIASLPMGIDGAFFTPGDRDAARRELGLSSERAEILFVGDLTPQKGVSGLAREVTGSRPIRSGVPRRLNLAGVGPETSLLKELQDRDPRQLRVLGRLSPRELSLWYRGADLLVLPSRAEGMPVSVMEAQACGLPVVANDVGGVRELVEPGVSGWLVSPRASSREFLDVVDRALDSPDTIQEMRAELARGGHERTAVRRARELASVLEEVARGEGR